MNEAKAIQLVEALGDYIRAIVEYSYACHSQDSGETGWFPTSSEAEKAEILVRLLMEDCSMTFGTDLDTGKGRLELDPAELMRFCRGELIKKYSGDCNGDFVILVQLKRPGSPIAPEFSTKKED